MKHLIVLLTVLLFTSGAYSQKVLFKTIVKEKGSNITIPAATIKITDSDDNVRYTITDDNGAAQFYIDNDFNIEIRSMGFKTLKEDISYSNYNEFYLEDDYLQIEQVVVTGTRTKKQLKDSPILTQVITAKDIEKVDAVCIEDVLENEIPGLEFGHGAMGTTVSIQGLGAKYILFLVDGVRIAGETNGNINFSMIDQDNIQRIEYIKGAASTLYGSSAIAGVVNIITKQPVKKWNGSVSLRYGESNKQDHSKKAISYTQEKYNRDLMKNQDLRNLNANVNFGYKNDVIFTNTNFNYKSRDGYELNSSPQSGYLDYIANQKIGIKHGRFNTVIVGSLYYQEEFDFKMDGFHGRDFSYKYGINSTYNLNKKIKFKGSVNRDIYDKNKYNEKEGTDVLEYQNVLTSGKLISSYSYTKDYAITGGLETLREALESDRLGGLVMKNKESTEYISFVQNDITFFDRLNIVGGIRFGYHSNFKSYFTPNLSLKYKVSNCNLRLTYSEGYRTPTLKELYMSWGPNGVPIFIIGNKNLIPEQSRYYSSSVEYTNSKIGFNTSITGYYTSIRDQITYVFKGDNNGKSEYISSNVDHAKISGITILARARLAFGFSAKSSYTYTNEKSEIDGKNVSQIRPHTMSSQLEYKFKRNNYSLTAVLSGRYVSSKEFFRFDVDIEGYKKVIYDSFSIWKLSVNQKFWSHYKIAFGFNNIFDYTPKVYSYNTTISLGRRYFVKLTYTL